MRFFLISLVLVVASIYTIRRRPSECGRGHHKFSNTFIVSLAMSAVTSRCSTIRI